MSETCGQKVAACECRLEAGHEGPHRCLGPTNMGRPCGGSWEGREEDDTLRPLTWPDGTDVSDDSALGLLVRLLGLD